MGVFSELDLENQQKESEGHDSKAAEMQSLQAKLIQQHEQKKASRRFGSAEQGACGEAGCQNGSRAGRSCGSRNRTASPARGSGSQAESRMGTAAGGKACR